MNADRSEGDRIADQVGARHKLLIADIRDTPKTQEPLSYHGICAEAK